MSKHRVFVYGTLKQGYRNHFLLRGQAFLGERTTEPKFVLYDFGKSYTNGNWPQMHHDEANGVAVRGELYEVDDRCLDALDKLESYPEYYDRKLIELPGDAPAMAYIPSAKYHDQIKHLRRIGSVWPLPEKPKKSKASK